MIKTKNTIFVDKLNLVWNDKLKVTECLLELDEGDVVERGTVIFDKSCKEYNVVMAIYERNQTDISVGLVEYIGYIRTSTIVERTATGITTLAPFRRDYGCTGIMNYFIVVDDSTWVAASEEVLFIPSTASINYQNQTMIINYRHQI